MNTPLDPRLAKVVALMRSTTHAGEKAAAEARARDLATAAGMTLDEAIAAVDAPPPPTFRNIFDGFDDFCEAREPGYKARRASEKAEAERQRLERRAAVIAHFGSEEAALSPCERELLLHRALAPWRHTCKPPWQRWTWKIDGCSGLMIRKNVPDFLCNAIESVFPMPTSFAAAFAEWTYWIARRQDLEDVLGPGSFGDSGLDSTAELRLELLRPLVEHELRAESLRDLRDRLRYFDEFDVMDKGDIIAALVRDADVLIAAQDAYASSLSAVARRAHPSDQHTAEADDPSNATDRNGRIRAALDANPARPDRDVARACNCSPTTVGKVRRAMGLTATVRSDTAAVRSTRSIFLRLAGNDRQDALPQS